VTFSEAHISGAELVMRTKNLTIAENYQSLLMHTMPGWMGLPPRFFAD